MSMRSGIVASTLAFAALMLGGTVTPVRAADLNIGVTVVGEEPAPTFVEEGSTLNGTVVVAPANISDYVFINGGWYYYHPTLNTWVHVNHDKAWQPSGHVFHKWSEHPMYHRK